MAPPRQAIDSSIAAQRARVAFELFDVAQAIMRQNLRRKNPDLSDAEIETLLTRWRLTRPGAEYGDGVGRSIQKDEFEEWLASRKS